MDSNRYWIDRLSKLVFGCLLLVLALPAAADDLSEAWCFDYCLIGNTAGSAAFNAYYDRCIFVGPHQPDYTEQEVCVVLDDGSPFNNKDIPPLTMLAVYLTRVVL